MSLTYFLLPCVPIFLRNLLKFRQSDIFLPFFSTEICINFFPSHFCGTLSCFTFGKSPTVNLFHLIMFIFPFILSMFVPVNLDGEVSSNALAVRSSEEEGIIKETVLRARTVYDKAYSTLKSQGTYYSDEQT